METLPVEMVPKISQHLTPEDLSHCCGVSRRWREIFSHDWLWQSHCDPKLEEHLRTTPPVVEPVFVTPGGEDSTLAPIGPWRLAFLMEKHLISNWKHNYHKTETLNTLSGEVHREFLTNTLLVRWCQTCIEVWDVSAIPSVCVAKTDPSVVNIENWSDCHVADNNLLVIEQISSVKVFLVDLINNTIHLKLEISLNDLIGKSNDSEYMEQLHKLRVCQKDRKYELCLNCVKRNVFIHVNVGRSYLDIYNIETGEKIKQEYCPAKEISGGEKPKILGISTTPTTDYIVVILDLNYVSNCLYIYNTQTLLFLSDPFPIGKREFRFFKSVFHRHYIAFRYNQNGSHRWTLYDCHARKVLLKTPITDFVVGGNFFYSSESNHYFVFNDICSCDKLKMVSLTDKISKTIIGPNNLLCFKVFNYKLLVAKSRESGWNLLSRKEWVKSDIDFDHTEVNVPLTKAISQTTQPEALTNVIAQAMQGLVCTSLSTLKFKQTKMTRQRSKPVYIHHYW